MKASRLVTSLGILVALLAPGLAGAAGNPQSLTISPASTAPSVAPGGSYSGNLTILNGGSSGYTVSLYASPYHVNGVEYDPSFTQLPGTTDASKWVHLAKTSLNVPAQETVTVSYVLNVPPKTAPGGYYAVVFVQTQPTVGSGVQSSSRVGDILYITVQGPVHQGGAIIATPLPHLSTASNLPLSLEVSNTGGVHYMTTAVIQITNLFGKTVFSGSYQRYVLPQTIRKISTSWHTPAVGFYHVKRTATVAGRGETLPSAWLIVVHPLALVVLVIVILLVIAAISLPFVRRPNRKAGK